MKILYLDQYFSTRKGISGTRSYEFARLLVKMGHQVTMLTTASRYSGEMQEKFWVKKDVEGIRVHSLRIGYSSRMGYGRRAVSFLSFMLFSSLLGIFLPRADVVLATSTPLSVGVPGFLITRIRGGRFVFEVRDLWPEAPVQLGIVKNKVLKWFLYGLERFFYQNATRIIALSPGMAEGVIRRGVSPSHVELVPNACDLDLPDGAQRPEVFDSLDLSGKFVYLYAGAMGPANGIDYLLDLARAAKKNGYSALHFLAVGDGPCKAELMDLAKEQELSNLTFLNSVPRKDVAGFILASHATLTLFADLPILATNSPNKLFDYLSCGRPALVNSRGWTRDLVEQADAGFFLPPEDPEAAIRALSELAADPARVEVLGKNAREVAQTRFDRKLLLAQFEACLKNAVNDQTIQGFAGRLAKRAFDILLSGAALVVFSPILLAICLGISVETPGGVFYRQWRSGRNGRTFRIFKFRTMVAGAENAGLGLNVEQGDARITKVGHFLREWSLDELPQLIDVFLGRMSIVGPRPPLPSQIVKYNEEQRRRLQVKPGITGWAQVNGRNALSWADRIKRDVWYVDHVSMRLDLKIILRTFGVVLSRKGLYEQDGGTDDSFNQFEQR